MTGRYAVDEEVEEEGVVGRRTGERKPDINVNIIRKFID